MTTTYSAAVKSMESQFNSYWLLNSALFFGYIPEVEWYGKESKGKVDRSKVWVRFLTQNVYEEQQTLSDFVDKPFSRRFEISGLVFVQIFIPKTIANGVIKGRDLAEVARNCFRGRRIDGIVFRNVRINELPSEELFYRLNVVGEYEFSELSIIDIQDDENVCLDDLDGGTFN